MDVTIPETYGKHAFAVSVKRLAFLLDKAVPTFNNLMRCSIGDLLDFENELLAEVTAQTPEVLCHSDRTMDGDFILSKGRIFQVQIQDFQGSYSTVNGVYTNVAIDNRGFFVDVLTGREIRTQWGSVAIVKRAHPQLFN